MAFEDLRKKLSPTIKRIAYKLNGHYRSFNHDDLYQEALLHLWNDFNAGKLADKTDSYILQGCYFHLKNYIRKAKERPGMVSLDNLEDEDGEYLGLKDILSCRDLSCFDNIHAGMLEKEILNNGLTKREKAIFSLSLLGLTVREIGARIGVSHARVIKIKNTIKEKCRKHFDNDGFGPEARIFYSKG